MIFRVSIEVPGHYGITAPQIKAILSNNLWFAVRDFTDNPEHLKSFNSDVKIFVGVAGND